MCAKNRVINLALCLENNSAFWKKGCTQAAFQNRLALADMSRTLATRLNLRFGKKCLRTGITSFLQKEPRSICPLFIHDAPKKMGASREMLSPRRYGVATSLLSQPPLAISFSTQIESSESTCQAIFRTTDTLKASSYTSRLRGLPNLTFT